MSLVVKALKELYLSLLQVACIAYLLQNCAMRVRACLKDLDDVLATIKAATIKDKDRIKDFHEASQPSLPDPVTTRRATWLRAALYCSEYFPAVSTIVNNCIGGGLLVSRAKKAINMDNLEPGLVDN